MSGWDIYTELIGLAGQDPQAIIRLAEQAHRAGAPQGNADLQALLAQEMYLYQSFDSTARQLMIDCQLRADALGAPTDVLLSEISAPEYNRKRNLIASKSRGRIQPR